MSVAANLIADDQRRSGHEVELIETKEFVSSPQSLNPTPISAYAEIWVHGMWLPMTMRACWKVIRAQASGVRLIRMTHGCLSPIYLDRQGKWKKKLVAPIERWLFARTSRVVVTCEAERQWCEQWGVKGPFEVVDLKKYFDLGVRGQALGPRALHVLYLGRRHPLKGVQYLEQAVERINGRGVDSCQSLVASGKRLLVELRIETSVVGEEKERAWEWCDVLCLPTLSDNFGLVVAEALEHGKRVITTDGAPAWDVEKSLVDSRQSLAGRLIYLRGFREGTEEKRVELLVEAMEKSLRFDVYRSGT